MPATAGMVSSEEKFASQIGAQILEKGGNAVDAAVAIGFALSVTLPKAGNLAGGGFMMIHDAKHQKNTAIDYRETAPGKAHRDMYIVDGQVDQNMLRYSGKSTAVPGTVAGLIYAQKKYGKLTLSEVITPAIRLAEEGFPISWGLSESLKARAKRLKADAGFAKVFYPAKGGFYPHGYRLIRKDLAHTLKLIRKKGRDGFYKGEVADKLIRAITRFGGIMTKDDLSNYRPTERQPVTGTYLGYSIVTMPPPSSGGVHLIQMLNTLENFPLAKWGANRAKTIQVMVEAMRSAYADRSYYLGDPDFVKIPVKQLTSKAYAKHISEQITLGKARKSTDVKPGNLTPYESPQTTHFSVIDKDGNMVSNTYTLNYSYGSGHMVAGTGIVLNNEMDDFSAKPGVPNGYGLVGGEANSVQPGKRPLSSMTPTLVFKDGQPFLATGSPGGSTIITVTMETIVNVLAFDMNIAAATAWPRFHHQWLPDVVFVEPGISEDTNEKLREMGYKIKKGRTLGNTQSIQVINGMQFGSADPRRPGGTVVAAKASTK
ncbi:MAG TPA: gamma-glutamyltransferase [Aeromonadales bacterium]|nr:gamma-glutamyltransferase [Aeromonadales bacterium]